MKGAKPPKAVAAPKEEKKVETKEAMAPWGTPALREAAFRALRRAQRTNVRRVNAPKWFTAEQLVSLASNPELAESMMPPAPVKAVRAREDDGDEDEDEEEYDDDE